MRKIGLLAVMWGAFACGGKDTGSLDEGDAVGGPSTGTTDGGTYAIEFETEPSPIPLSEDFVMRTRVSDSRGVWIDEASVVVNADMPTHGHGMNTIPITTFVGDGWYETTGMLFHMPGSWQITFDIQVDGIYETAVMPYECCF